MQPLPRPESSERRHPQSALRGAAQLSNRLQSPPLSPFSDGVFPRRARISTTSVTATSPLPPSDLPLLADALNPQHSFCLASPTVPGRMPLTFLRCELRLPEPGPSSVRKRPTQREAVKTAARFEMDAELNRGLLECRSVDGRSNPAPGEPLPCRRRAQEEDSTEGTARPRRCRGRYSRELPTLHTEVN